MREWLFIFLYGALTLAAFFLCLFWTRFAHKRRKLLGNVGILADRYYLLSAGIAMNAGGMMLLCGFRAGSNIHYGLSRALYGFEGVGVAIGLTTVLMSKVLLVWVADLEQEPAVWTWTKWMAVITSVWGIAAIFISTGLPPGDIRP